MFSSPKEQGMCLGILQRLALWFLSGYRNILSPFLKPRCRFVPSCSSYAFQAIQDYGVVRGGVLTALRITRCHPLHPGGTDPVPQKLC